MPSLQIRNVTDEVHRILKSRAALAGMSLSEYALAELTRAAERPTDAEVLARIAALPPIELDPPASELVRAERDAR